MGSPVAEPNGMDASLRFPQPTSQRHRTDSQTLIHLIDQCLGIWIDTNRCHSKDSRGLLPD
jgi:hypothetical protein